MLIVPARMRKAGAKVRFSCGMAKYSFNIFLFWRYFIPTRGFYSLKHADFRGESPALSR